MKTKTTRTYTVTIFMAGDISVARQVCREACMQKGLCVHIYEADFVYTGGMETGFAIGLINYPRFPVAERDLFGRAAALAEMVRERCCQRSYTLVATDKTVWVTTEDGLSVNCEELCAL